MRLVPLSFHVLSREGGTAGGVPGGDEKTRRVLRLVGDTASRAVPTRANTGTGTQPLLALLALLLVPSRWQLGSMLGLIK